MKLKIGYKDRTFPTIHRWRDDEDYQGIWYYLTWKDYFDDRPWDPALPVFKRLTEMLRRSE